MATFTMSSGYTKYLTYCAKAETNNSLYDLNPATIKEIKSHSTLLMERINMQPKPTPYPTWPKPMDENPFHLNMINPQLTHGSLTDGYVRKSNPVANPVEPEALAEAKKADAELYFLDKSSKETQILQIHYDFRHQLLKKLG